MRTTEREKGGMDQWISWGVCLGKERKAYEAASYVNTDCTTVFSYVDPFEERERIQADTARVIV